MKRLIGLILVGFAAMVFAYTPPVDKLPVVNEAIAKMMSVNVGAGAASCDDSGTSVVWCDGSGGTSDCDGTGDGFESPWSPTGNTGNWSEFNNTPASEAVIVKRGSISMEIDGADRGTGYDIADSTHDEIWIDWWFYVGAEPNTDATSMGTLFIIGAYDSVVYTLIQADDNISLYDGGTQWDASPAVDINASTWYHAYLHIDNASGDGSEELQLAVNTSDTWDSWDISQTALTQAGEYAEFLAVGNNDFWAGQTVMYLDQYRIWSGSDMPCEWQ